ncbi:MAG: hypothetical protein BGO51_12225 [Rhodospirillales bacterium 69-11]|nr:hypothetical protein [Rhodospirillales bacterium]MBN8926562.1 hypothetical protein [Rhodospirillales bacterium]OJW24850.1 MAG: hypothetical protein BGO51_12225 [Rhodospirillales bacterium 69-11]
MTAFTAFRPSARPNDALPLAVWTRAPLLLALRTDAPTAALWCRPRGRGVRLGSALAGLAAILPVALRT